MTAAPARRRIGEGVQQVSLTESKLKKGGIAAQAQWWGVINGQRGYPPVACGVYRPYSEGKVRSSIRYLRARSR